MATTRRTSKTKTVVGVFERQDDAQAAVRELRDAGFREDQIGVITRDSQKKGKAKASKRGAHAAEGAGIGLAAGAGIGALYGLGLVSGVALPVIGPAIAAGTLATILGSAAAGAAIAGVAGALIGLGIPEEDARYYESEVHAGRTVVTVKANGRADEAWAILSRHGAYNRASCEAQTARTTTTSGRAASAAGERTVEVREEELEAHKRPVKKGEVRVRKEMTTEQETLSVPVTREEVVVERRPAGRRRASSSDLRPGEEVRIPVTEEEVRVEKRPVVKEEVTVGKRKVQDTKQVSGRVRKEKVRVEEEGDVKVRGRTAGTRS
jgi:uncharacterized protein (TIGR02271 family)